MLVTITVQHTQRLYNYIKLEPIGYQIITGVQQRSIKISKNIFWKNVRPIVCGWLKNVFILVRLSSVFRSSGILSHILILVEITERVYDKY